MFYSEGFLNVLLFASLFCLVPVFVFQVYYFIRDIKNKVFWK
jgi:hypothetical protein